MSYRNQLFSSPFFLTQPLPTNGPVEVVEWSHFLWRRCPLVFPRHLSSTFREREWVQKKKRLHHDYQQVSCFITLRCHFSPVILVAFFYSCYFCSGCVRDCRERGRKTHHWSTSAPVFRCYFSTNLLVLNKYSKSLVSIVLSWRGKEFQGKTLNMKE